MYGYIFRPVTVGWGQFTDWPSTAWTYLWKFLRGTFVSPFVNSPPKCLSGYFVLPTTLFKYHNTRYAVVGAAWPVYLLEEEECWLFFWLLPKSLSATPMWANFCSPEGVLPPNGKSRKKELWTQNPIYSRNTNVFWGGKKWIFCIHTMRYECPIDLQPMWMNIHHVQTRTESTVHLCPRKSLKACIHKSISPAGAPVHCTFYMDCKALNQGTILNWYPLPLIPVLLECMWMARPSRSVLKSQGWM